MTASLPIPVPRIVHAGQPVITTELLATLYDADAQQIRQNFNNNERRFVEGKHYYKLTGDPLRALKNQVDQIDVVPKRAAHLTLWTERGAARHAKMLETDVAWDVFETLEDSYFARREVPVRNTPDRLTARRDAASNYSVLSEMLVLTREAEGKPTKAHHFANEARLVNEAFAGVFGPLDRDTLSAAQLRILNRLQVRDAALIGSGKTYAERKSLLASYATSLRAAPRLSGGVQ